MTFRISDRVGQAVSAALLLIPAAAVAEVEWKVFSGILAWMDKHDGAAAWGQAIFSAAAIYGAFAVQDYHRRSSAREAGERQVEAMTIIASSARATISGARGDLDAGNLNLRVIEYYGERLKAEAETLGTVDLRDIPSRTIALQLLRIRTSIALCVTALGYAKDAIAAGQTVDPKWFEAADALAGAAFVALRDQAKHRG